MIIADAEPLEIFELTVEITEGGGVCDGKMRRGAGEMSSRGIGLADGMKAGWQGEVCGEAAEEAVQALVNAAYAFESGNSFLADIAAFVKINGGVFEAGFLRQGVLVDFKAPCGLAVDDAEEGELLGSGSGEAGGFLGGVETGKARSIDAKGSGRGLDAEDVIEQRRHGHGLKAGIIRYEIALEASLNSLGEGFVALDDKIVAIAPDLHEGAEFSFGGQEAGGGRNERLEAGDVDAYLAVQVTRGVGAAELETGAALDLKKT